MSDSPQSPPKEVDQGAQSPEDEAQMNEQQDPQSANTAGYEFEGVKEQDRWLPIANGKCSIPRGALVVICSFPRARAARSLSLLAVQIWPAPCLAIRPPSRPKRLAPPRPIELMSLMLTFATLLQLPAS